MKTKKRVSTSARRSVPGKPNIAAQPTKPTGFKHQNAHSGPAGHLGCVVATGGYISGISA